MPATNLKVFKKKKVVVYLLVIENVKNGYNVEKNLGILYTVPPTNVLVYPIGRAMIAAMIEVYWADDPF